MSVARFCFVLWSCFFSQCAAQEFPVMQLSLAPPPLQNKDLAKLIGQLEATREVTQQAAIENVEKQYRTAMVGLEQKVGPVVNEALRGKLPAR